MKLAIYALTSRSYEHALKIKAQVQEATIFTKPELTQEEAHKMQGKFSDVVANEFNQFDCHLFVMATGIVVRLITPLLKHKSLDPAVLVSDEKGTFLISLLSGHIGRANEYCLDIAKRVGSQPVITTASDVQGKMAVDTLGMKVNGQIYDFERAKNLTALIVEDKQIGIVSDVKIDFDLPSGLEVISSAEGKDGYLYLSNRSVEEMKEPFAYIRLPRIVLGIGCKKGKTKEQIRKAVTSVLDELKIPISCVIRIGTIDVKANEQGLLDFVETLKVPLQIWSREEVARIQDQFEGSSFVFKQIGVSAVAEPVGYLSSNHGTQITGKLKKEGITISVWEERHA